MKKRGNPEVGFFAFVCSKTMKADNSDMSNLEYCQFVDFIGLKLELKQDNPNLEFLYAESKELLLDLIIELEDSKTLVDKRSIFLKYKNGGKKIMNENDMKKIEESREFRLIIKFDEMGAETVLEITANSEVEAGSIFFKTHYKNLIRKGLFSIKFEEIKE